MHVFKYLALLSLAVAMTSITGCDDSAHRAWVLAGVPMGPEEDSYTGPSCTPACGDRVCGPDPVCGESCGSCGSPNTCNSEGQCECVKDCSGRVCGPDPVCGESCGSCSSPNTCNSEGQCECIKDCGGRVCGPDPVCGESCGTCDSDEFCDGHGQCIAKPDTNIEWVRIAGGTFEMGSNDFDWAQPVHSVTVPTFEMTRTEVTVEQYKACVDAGSCSAPDDGWESCNWGYSDRGSHPINCVDWDQAQDFANWVGGRLPSEAEWEYAARSGGRDWKYPWGDEAATCERAVMYDGGDGCGRDSTWPVCSKPSGNTTHGLCDMAGNVWEWVQDWYHDSYDGAPTDGSAWETPTGSDRVNRGGSWYFGARFVRAAYRNGGLPGDRFGGVGFRLARSVR